MSMETLKALFLAWYCVGIIVMAYLFFRNWSDMEEIFDRNEPIGIPWLRLFALCVAIALFSPLWPIAYYKRGMK